MYTNLELELIKRKIKNMNEIFKHTGKKLMSQNKYKHYVNILKNNGIDEN